MSWLSDWWFSTVEHKESFREDFEKFIVERKNQVNDKPKKKKKKDPVKEAARAIKKATEKVYIME